MRRCSVSAGWAAIARFGVRDRCCGCAVPQRWLSTAGEGETTAGARNHFRGLSFSGCGWLLPFHAGVANALIDAGALRLSTPPPATHARDSGEQYCAFAGASGGALIAAALACGITPHAIMEQVLALAHTCRGSGTWWRLKQPLANGIRELLPGHAMDMLGDTHRDGVPRLQVAVTKMSLRGARFKVSPQRPLPIPLPHMISEFDSEDDLVAALVTSSFVPGTRMRGWGCGAVGVGLWVWGCGAVGLWLWL